MDLQLKMEVERVKEYMDAAIVAIEKTFGDGYACKHPELVAGFMQAIALDNQATALDNIDATLDNIYETLVELEQKM